MSQARNYLTDALVLRTRPLGEKDRIVSLLSREHGRIASVAKGARRPGSRLAAATQPFTYAQFALARGRQLDIVTQVVIHEAFYGLHANVIASACASSATELLDRVLSERHAEPALFELLMETLRALSAGENCEVMLRAYQLRAATLLGYEPELKSCVRCRTPLTAHLSPLTPHLSFSFTFGGMLCADCRSNDLSAPRLGGGMLELLRSLLEASPPKLQSMRVADSMRGQLTRLVEGWLEERLEVRLKSRVFLSQVLAAAAPPPSPRARAGGGGPE